LTDVVPLDGTVQELTYETFREKVPDQGVVVVEFTAAWCGPCQWFLPVFAASAAAHSDVLHARVDVESEDALAKTFALTSIPTVAVIHDRVLIFQHPGALQAEDLEDVVQQAKAASAA
jgi:thioredoxin-like negative regulator of GroEL